jgi:ASCH domain
VTGYRRPAVKALTVRQPWAWAIIYGGKDIENRRWRTAYRGPLLIHAGKAADPAGSAELLWTMADPEAIGQPRAAWEARGAFIGLVHLADILTDSPSRWAIPGWYHWVLEFPSPIEPAVRHRGRQRLWTPPPAVLQGVADVL